MWQAGRPERRRAGEMTQQGELASRGSWPAGEVVIIQSYYNSQKKDHPSFMGLFNLIG